MHHHTHHQPGHRPQLGAGRHSSAGYGRKETWHAAAAMHRRNQSISEHARAHENMSIGCLRAFVNNLFVATQAGLHAAPTLCTHAAACSLRMSYVYRLQSSLAAVKLKASMGFHATAFVRVCMTSLRMGRALRRSYSAMLRSPPVLANTSDSACAQRKHSPASRSAGCAG